MHSQMLYQGYMLVNFFQVHTMRFGAYQVIWYRQKSIVQAVKHLLNNVLIQYDKNQFCYMLFLTESG